MKGFFLALLLTATVSIVHAQLRIAVVAGGHKAEIVEENDLPGFEDFKKGYTGRGGAHYGFIADIPFTPRSSFSFQPGVIYYNRGRKFASQEDNGLNIVYTNSQQYVNYIDIPLNLVYKIRLSKKVKFILGGGPHASLFYSGKEKKEVIDGPVYTLDENDDLAVGDGPGKYKVFHYGANALAGFEFGRVFITANYTQSLNDFYHAKDYTGTFRHKTIGATLGIFLGKQTPPPPKVKDKDGDGIPDDQDGCPDMKGPELTHGCPDKDGDGIADKDDQCVSVPGTKAYKGCPAPADKDGDGITDNNDKCPDVPGLARYEGCPATDTDRDGINDDEDKCPDVVGLGRYQGCPVPDTDKDGVNDEKDKCPTVPGLKEKNGCPAEEIKKEIVDKVNYAAKRIQFAFAKAELTQGSKKVLDEVVTVMKQNKQLNLFIEGHTSVDAAFDANMKLSQERADEVKKYLESKGIEGARMETKGFGPTQPLNKGRTEAEKALNRRVELKLSN